MSCLDTCLVLSIIVVFNIIFGIGWTFLITAIFVLLQVLIQKSCFGRQVSVQKNYHFMRNHVKWSIPVFFCSGLKMLRISCISYIWTPGWNGSRNQERKENHLDNFEQIISISIYGYYFISIYNNVMSWQRHSFFPLKSSTWNQKFKLR